MGLHVLVLGAGGLLGSALLAHRRAGLRVTGLTHTECDITSRDQVTAAVRRHRPDAVVNTAAVATVRACEADPVKALHVNTRGVVHCVEAANDVGAAMVQISGSVVFAPSPTPRREGERPDPPDGILAASKTEAEDHVRSHARHGLVVRTSLLFGDRPDGQPAGLAGIVLAAGPSGDVTMSATAVSSFAYAPDVAEAVISLVEGGHQGVFHAVNPGPLSPADFSRQAADLAGRTDLKVHRCDGQPGRILDTTLTASLGAGLRPLEDALTAYTAGRRR